MTLAGAGATLPRMYIYARRRQSHPARSREAMAFAIQSGSRASQITGHDVSTWTTVWSPDVGLLVWAVVLEHLEDLATGADKLAADSGFGDLVAENDALFNGPVQDSLVQVIHGTPPADRPDYFVVTSAQCANGSLRAGVAAAVELAEAASRITGHPIVVGADQTGPYGGINWYVAAHSPAEIEQANGALTADDGWIELVDRLGPKFQQGVMSMTLRRIG